MRVVVITPPAPVVSLADAKQHLRVDGDAEDALIEGYVAAATAHIDGPDGWLGRAIGVQTLEARFDGFTDVVRLPYEPIVDVVSVSYLDIDGTVLLVDASLYEVRGALFGTAFGNRWPSTAWAPEAVRVRYRAGYETLPAPIRAAILLMAGDLYRNRDTTLDGTPTAIPMATSVTSLLTPYRVFA